MLAFVLLGAASASVPTLLFSQTDLLGNRYSELPMPIETATLDATVQSMLGATNEDSLIEAKTSHVVVFRATGSAADLEPLVGASKSSLGLPYASGLNVEEGSVVVTDADELAKATVNGLPRVMIVDVSDNLLETVASLNLISKDYVGVAMVTPVTPRSLAATGETPAEAAAEPKAAKPTAKVATLQHPNGEQVLMISPPILTGLLAGLLWLTIFFSGFCCLFQLQTQDRFEEKCLTINKEY